MIDKKHINMLLEQKLLTPEKFNDKIEANRYRFDGYLETIADYCNVYSMEIGQVKKILNPQILSKLTAECERSNLITKTSNSVSLFE